MSVVSLLDDLGRLYAAAYIDKKAGSVTVVPIAGGKRVSLAGIDADYIWFKSKAYAGKPNGMMGYAGPPSSACSRTASVGTGS